MGSSRFARKVAIGLLASTAVVGLSVSAGVAGAASAAPQTRHPLTGSTPKWLPFARDMGTTVSTDPVSFGVLLGMRDAASAQATLKAVSDPRSASYGHYLTNKQFDAKYAPAPSSVTAVRNWLRDQGFKVTKTLPSGMYVAVSGTVGQVESTFGSKIHNYAYQGKQVFANTGQLSLPAGTPTAVSGAISGIVGVDQGSELKQAADTLPGPPPGARFGVQPCSAYYGQKTANAQPAVNGKHQPYAVCGYTPSQLQFAYGESSLIK